MDRPRSISVRSGDLIATTTTCLDPHTYLQRRNWLGGDSSLAGAVSHVYFQLGDVSITVPDLANLDTLAARLRARTIPFDADGRSVSVSDPWGTRVTVALPDLSTEELLSR